VQENLEEPELHSTAQLAHTLLRLVLAVRYRKNLVMAVMTGTTAMAMGAATGTARNTDTTNRRRRKTQPRKSACRLWMKPEAIATRSKNLDR
jgi:hypothetical protein